MKGILLALFAIGNALNAKVPKRLEIDEDGGYIGLVVGISDTVAADYTLIRLLQELLQAEFSKKNIPIVSLESRELLWDKTPPAAYAERVEVFIY